MWLLRFHLACAAGIRKGRGRELGRETTCPTLSGAPKFPLPLPLPLPLLTPATQARFQFFRCHRPGADPGFFLGGGALVPCSTSTPINHSFFCRIPVVLENRRSSQGVGGGHTPCTLPLDPPLQTERLRLQKRLKRLKVFKKDSDVNESWREKR